MSRSIDKLSSFMTGITVGAVAGIVAGILLAPKSGEETRKELKKTLNDLSEKAKVEYKKAKRIVDAKLAKLKEVGAKIDKEKYQKLIDEVVAELKRDAKVSDSVVQEVKKQLSKDYNMFKTEISQPTVKRKTKKNTK